mgnify:CR=1 FL=1
MPLLPPLNPPLRDWRGQTVWIIGASTGIGRATAAALVPVLSALWLLLQITRFVARWRRGATE